MPCGVRRMGLGRWRPPRRGHGHRRAARKRSACGVSHAGDGGGEPLRACPASGRASCERGVFPDRGGLSVPRRKRSGRLLRCCCHRCSRACPGLLAGGGPGRRRVDVRGRERACGMHRGDAPRTRGGCAGMRRRPLFRDEARLRELACHPRCRPPLGGVL